MTYNHVVFLDDYEIFGAMDISLLFKALKAAGYQLGMIVRTMMGGYREGDCFWSLYSQVDCVVHETRTEEEPELDGRLLKEYMERYQVDRSEILFVGCDISDMENVSGAGVDCGPVLWGCENPRHARATYYFSHPYDIWNQLSKIADPFQGKEWVDMVMEMQFIAQIGVTYIRGMYDEEWFERVREPASQVMEIGTGLPIERIRDLFCNRMGCQAPKLDSRVAISQGSKILLVRERKGGLWSLPGGWVDASQNIASNTVKRVKKEAGLDVAPVRLIALHDRDRHSKPLYAYGICRAFMFCEAISGEFERNYETDASEYSGSDELPPLSVDRVTMEQIQMCFVAYKSKHWEPTIDQNKIKTPACH